MFTFINFFKYSSYFWYTVALNRRVQLWGWRWGQIVLAGRRPASLFFRKIIGIKHILLQVAIVV